MGVDSVIAVATVDGVRVRFLQASRADDVVTDAAREGVAAGVPDLLRLLVKRPTILAAVGTYETALLVSNRVDGRLKALAMLRASSLIGCPF